MRCHDQYRVRFQLGKVIIEEDGLDISVGHVAVLLDICLTLGDLATRVVGRVVVAYFTA